MRITGTFLDEITHDIPSNNWGRHEWAEDFKTMKSIGIDTVIMIRAGWGRKAACPSKVLEQHADIFPVYADLVDMFLDLAQENDMAFFFGTYDSATHPSRARTLQHELDLGKAFIDEMWARYGQRQAFKGWYLTFEIGKLEKRRVACLRELGAHCKTRSPHLPTLISPYLYGDKLVDDPITLDRHYADWDQILAELKGVVDIVAFQDGQVDYDILPDFLKANSELIQKYNMRAWSNVESFDRDMPFNFPPIDWRKLWWKMQAAQQAGVEKLITFEFSHFMSPHSCWPAAKNLFDRYREYIASIKL
ncbi:MAG: DUF4434 domain-containing protein [Anaerolineae bacterium]|nr:DUF4434 domain-containing protein [Anaerolineae bacterium]